MNKNLKKARELYFLKRFQGLLPIPFSIEESDREAPDFIIRSNEKLIGVEITEIFIKDNTRHKHQTLKSVETLGDKIINKAKIFYNEATSPPVHLTVNFSSHANFNDIRRDELARNIATFVRDRHLKEWEYYNYNSKDYTPPLLSREIDAIRAFGVPDHSFAHWRVARAGWVAPLTPERIQSCIDDKTHKLTKYKNVVGENWLIIAREGRNPSQAIYVPPEFSTKTVNSPFDKTFYLDIFDGICLEIK